jgi:hypothetical protein
MDIGLGEEPGQSKDKIEEEYYFEVGIEVDDTKVGTGTVSDPY